MRRILTSMREIHILTNFKIYFRNLIKKAFVAAIVGFPLMINKFWQWLPSINQSCIQWLWVIIIRFFGFFVLYYSWWPLDEHLRVRPGKKVPVDGKLLLKGVS